MSGASADSFRCFPWSAEAEAWGLAATGAGFTRIPPHSAYPPARHPADHHFAGSRGRILEALQVVLIINARGRLERRGRRLQRIEAGSAFMLLPGVWHRFRPDAATGWEESWVELRGETVDRPRRRGLLRPEEPVRRHALAAGLEGLLEAVHARVRQPLPDFDAELAARGLAVPAAWQQAGAGRQRKSRLARAVAAAEKHLAEHLAEPVNMAGLARQPGVAYSHFRYEFKVPTGYSPWQYMLHLRRAQARRLLVAGDATLDEVAGRVGFSSAFHLSAAFKRAYGTAPGIWRRQFEHRGGA